MATSQPATSQAPAPAAAPSPAPSQSKIPPHPMSASLYVGELSPDVTETRLFEIFTQVGPVASIRVCRDSITRRSLGYAYVNFVNAVDAERALDTLNNVSIRGKPCRIMWSQRDPTIRKSGIGNIFIKNLDPSIGHKELYDTFSQFGNILSCKVATDENGKSKGYGFVHFASAESAERSIAKVNGMLLGNMKVYVGKFIPKKEWLKQKENSWTNIFCKNLPPGFTKEQLLQLFEPFGEITSAVVVDNTAAQSEAAKSEGDAAKGDGESAKTEGETPKAEEKAAGDKPTETNANEKSETKEGGSVPPPNKHKTLFGFVNFKNHDDAVKAVQALNGKILEDKYELYCNRAQKKAERAAELKKKFEQLKLERMTKYQGINLYIKNLEDEVDEERLKKEFGIFGKIKSVKVVSGRGFGFICFTTPEEANRALTEMNGRILPGCQKPLYVNLFEPKEVRKQKLAAQYAARMKARPAPAPGVPPTGLAYPPGVYYPPQGMQPGFPYPPQYRGPTAPRWAAPPPAGQQFPQPGIAPRAHQQPAPQPQGARPGAPPAAGRPVAQPAPTANGVPPAVQPGAQQRRPPQARPAPMPGPVVQPEPQLLTIQQIMTFPPEQQRMLIGERLYYKIQKKDPARAGKITGMLLDVASTLEELYQLLESDEALFKRVDEAIHVLEEAAKKQQQQQQQQQAAPAEEK